MRYNVSLPRELVMRVDARAAELGQARSRFIRRALEQALSGAPKVGAHRPKEPRGSAVPDGVARSAGSARASESEGESEYQRMLRIQRLGSKSA